MLNLVTIPIGKTVTKAMGFDLTYENCPLNFESFRKLILNRCGGTVEVPQRRTRKRTVNISKYNFTANLAKKRKLEILDDRIISKPWGFVE